jgi:hypothetical protein
VIFFISISSVFLSLRYTLSPIRDLDEVSDVRSALVERSSSNSHIGIPIFYNLYLKNESDSIRVYEFVIKQLGMRKSFHHPIYIHSIGFHDSNTNGSISTAIANATIIQYHQEGSELITLHSLWEFCHDHPAQTVVYMHSKGSYRYIPENEQLREFLSVGVLSDACAENVIQSNSRGCNVCSSRFSPLPHPHIPGNMWVAKCQYVQKLINPLRISERMEEIAAKLGYQQLSQSKHDHRRRRWYQLQQEASEQGRDEESCIGIGRFVAEHWILSHPSNRPCDLYSDPSFTWSYDNVPTRSTFNETTHMDLMYGPRFNLSTYIKKNACVGKGWTAELRLKEYILLYNQLPNEYWWGWKLYNKSYDDYYDTKYPAKYWSSS